MQFLLVLFLLCPTIALAQDPIEINVKCSLAEQKDCTQFMKTLSDAFGYKDFIPNPDNPGQNIANPQPRKEFIEQHLVSLLLQWGGSFEQQEQIKAAPDKQQEFRDKFKKRTLTTPRRSRRD